MTCLDTIPAYYRKHFTPGGTAMLKLHHHNPAAERPPHVSAAWIAHNAALDAKRATLEGRRIPAPELQLKTVRAHQWDKPMTLADRVKDVLLLVGIVTTIGTGCAAAWAWGFY